VDWHLGRRLRHRQLDIVQLTAESDRSPGVLLASGYIAGGAIAGIFIAFVQGFMTKWDARLSQWAGSKNPFFAGPSADWLSLLPFVALTVFLYLVGREVLFGNAEERSK